MQGNGVFEESEHSIFAVNAKDEKRKEKLGLAKSGCMTTYPIFL